MSTRLDRFKVYNFRSIEESDWIEVSDNSCLVGTNEAGKTNLLLAQGFLIKNEQPVRVYKIFNKIALLSFILAV